MMNDPWRKMFGRCVMSALGAGMLLAGAARPVLAHDWKPGTDVPETGPEREALRAHVLEHWQMQEREREQEKARADVRVNVSVTEQKGAEQGRSFSMGERAPGLWAPQLMLGAAASTAGAAAAAGLPEAAFNKFPALKLERQGDSLRIGGNGMPDHNMMVGITAWQQQVPLPQSYYGENAWTLPLRPVPAATPAMIKGRFLRGAIAIAVNGIPIFNPQNNRGEVSYEIGELDEWGGHCGRADDYHYHITPLHLQAQVGKGMPVAYALDGYPIYGLTEPDGSEPKGLDECHGHEAAGLGYHYHASMKYPYVIGGFHGQVTEAEEQVDPQPRANPVRPSLQALRGAKITAFESTGKDSYKLSYDVNGDKRSVSYTINAGGTYTFQFNNGREGVTEETYTAGGGGGGRGGRGGPGGPPPGGPEGRGKGQGQGKGKGGREREGEMRPPRPGEAETPPAPRTGMGEGERPTRPTGAGSAVAVEGLVDVNGDGLITAQEFADSAKATATRKGVALNVALAAAKEQFSGADHNRDGQLDRAEFEELTGSGGGGSARRGEGGERGMERPPQGEEGRGRGQGGAGGMERGGQGRGMERPPQGEEKRGGGGGKGGKEAFVERADQPRSSDGKFLLTSPVMEDMKEMPVEYTGDGEAATLPLAWKDAPAGTQSYALIMDHAAPGGDMKWYWTLYDLPKDLTALPRNVKNVGKVGTGFQGQVGYEPPHSKGPGAKVYVITLYALSAPVQVSGDPGREELLAAMKGKVLASSSFRVIHTSSGASGPGGSGSAGGNGGGGGERPRGGEMNEPPRGRGEGMREGGAGAPRGAPGGAPMTPPPAPREGEDKRPLDNIFAPTGSGSSAGSGASASTGSGTGAMNNGGGASGGSERPAAPGAGRGEGKGKGGGKSKGKGGPPGLVKPSLEDTMKLNVYADNWFMLYVNGRLVAVDPIQFTPHNVVSVDFLPEYPMTIAVLAKDNADPKTGMEYGTSVGDGGFILKFADGTVTNASWKAKNFFHGPVNGDTANPKVTQEPLPANWWAVDFDDSAWKNAKEYTEEQVDPKQPYYDSDFSGAKFIWTEDLALDNTIIFRTKVEKPGWTPRWNTKPDLDVTGAPVK